MAELSVHIAVPLDGNAYRIRLPYERPWFPVVIRNDSNKPQFLFYEDCSEGFDNLHLEITAVDDKTLAQPVVIQRPRHLTWGGNYIRTLMLSPGDTIVRQVLLRGASAADAVYVYENFPLPSRNNDRNVEMRTVFSVPKSPIFVPASWNGGPAWIGTVASEKRRYVLSWTHLNNVL